MVGRWMIALLFLLPAVVPGVQAQETEQTLLQDPAADVWAQAQQTGSGTNGVRYEPIDILSYGIEERDDAFTFTVGFTDLDPATDVVILDDTIYYIGFSKGDQDYLVRINRALAEQQYWWGTYLKYDPDQQGFTFIRPLAHRVDIHTDLAADTLSVTLEREELLDTLGAAPSPGDAITKFWAFAHLRTAEGFVNLGNINGQPISVGQGVDAWDMVPDDGTPAGTYDVQMGLRQDGNAALATTSPMRASNGEASTFVYTLVAENRGDKADVFELKALNVPGSWNVVIPDAFLHLEGGQTQQVPVLVSTPFAHRHGDVESFRVQMQSLSNAGTGRMDLGIRYHAVPQPAGHHDVLHFHSQRWGEENTLFPVTDAVSAGNGGQFYLNTLEDDENDQRVPVTANYQGYGFHPGMTQPASKWTWGIFLQPGLEMGLDFDLERTGTMTTVITTTEPIVQATLEGRLIHFGYDEAGDRWIPTDVAHLDATDPRDLTMGSEQSYEWTFNIHPEADLLEYTPRAFFGVILNLTSPKPSLFTGAEAPLMAPGGMMQLPLHEYRDPVDDLFQSVGSVMFHADGPQEKGVNPGETVLLRSQLMNHLPDAATFDLRIDGVNAEWASLPVDSLRLESNEARSVVLAVTVPADAAHGDAVDLVLSAQATHDPAIRTLVRLVAAVDTGTDHPDEAADLDALGGEVKESPLAVPALLLAALAFAARRRS